jgi:hypothetical protein
MNCRAAAKSVSSTPVKALAADARAGKFGRGFRARAGRATGLAAGGWCSRRPPCSTQYSFL